MKLKTALLAAASTSLLAFAGAATAQTTYNGPFVGNTVTYSNVIDGDDLFGAPTLSADTLNFTPVGFNAQSTNGGIDLVDGFLSTVIEANDGQAITGFTLQESGVFALDSINAATGTADTRVQVSVGFSVNILEVDGSAVSVPFIITDDVLLMANLADDRGIGQAWAASTSLDLVSLAAGQGVTGDITKAIVTLDNQLLAVSEAGTTSFVDKKGVRAVSITVPEPTSALFVLGAGAMLLRRRVAA
ncbi:PEP-CTERM sorting domain-containing protein [Phycisphaera mikurensis]|uniref:PEP-CTERM protein-sorting domain-containing protein n=1 Tax=Phycisphaera mikurensis (strain NBRC 102666 / KCTC 22515 / FYK2301M01) TaxID=1142394 RepID=I0IBJ7_PHYMF|nr:PEP-CTERM sorting domain-containing protein [Phycisphaera mikurensis]MBB6442835.1 hypothetical protein [Phycisphaera mikurensis]BAM02635.1 hypothetical protein PSMK_04760 [Phycisphaera mikurensis NBRC 102666]